MPSEMALASAAVSRRTCLPAIWPVLWHDAQLCSRIGATTVRNDGLSAAASVSTRSGPATSVATSVRPGSTAESLRVSATSSSVRTRPAIEMGPASKRESLAVVVAVATRRPSANVASTSKVAGAVVSLMATVPSIVNE